MLNTSKKSWGKASIPAMPGAGKTASASEMAIHRNESAADGQLDDIASVGMMIGIAAKLSKLINTAEKPAPVSDATITPPIILPPRIGPSNQGVMFCASRAKRVAVMLARRGYVIKKISVSPSIATVTLKSTRTCRELGGTQICRALCNGKDARTYAVLIDGVSVEWIVSSPWGQGDPI